MESGSSCTRSARTTTKLNGSTAERWNSIRAMRTIWAMFMEKVRKNYDEAERLYRKALELDPEKEIIRKNYETLKKQRDVH